MEDIKSIEKYLDGQIMKNFYTAVLGGAMEFELVKETSEEVIKKVIALYEKEGWYIHKTEGNKIKLRSKAAQGAK